MSRRTWFVIALVGLTLSAFAAGARMLDEMIHFSTSGAPYAEVSLWSRDAIDLGLLAGAALMAIGFGAALIARQARPSTSLPYISGGPLQLAERNGADSSIIMPVQ